MRWLYRLQQRLAITSGEGMAILVVAGLLLTGLTVRHLQQRSLLPPDTSGVRGAAFEERAAASVDSASADSAAQAREASTPPSGTGHAAGRIDLNTATVAELQQLPHIGPVLSRRIVAFREAHGGFRHTSDLQQVRGIGPKTIAQLEPLVAASAGR